MTVSPGTMSFTPPIATLARDGEYVRILDQTTLPFAIETRRLTRLEDAACAIRDMQVRGAPLIGVTAAYGIALALTEDATDAALAHAIATLGATRPTAVNLHWALARMQRRLAPLAPQTRGDAAWAEADAIRAEDEATCAAIGEAGVGLIADIAARRRGPVRIMTHCNAGWLATAGAGTALAPVYTAVSRGIPVEVWVSETRPRNQGLLTAWELREAGVAYRLIADNAAGLLMARGEVDLVITGADRIAANGDTANKVGTYLKALAAAAHAVPFHIAAPLSTMDFACANASGIPIEIRDAVEVREIAGMDAQGQPLRVRLTPDGTPALNPAFDVTPAHLIASIITERGCFPPAHIRAAQQGHHDG